MTTQESARPGMLGACPVCGHMIFDGQITSMAKVEEYIHLVHRTCKVNINHKPYTVGEPHD